MKNVFVTFYKDDTVHSTTAKMFYEEGLYKFPLGDITLLYDDREPATEFKWGYQIMMRTLRFYRTSKELCERVNLRFKFMNLQYSIDSFMIQKY